MQSARPAAELAKNLMANVRAMLSPDLTTETVQTVEHLVRLLPQWWALWDRCPSATPFQSPAWLPPWWRVFQPGELLIVTVRQDDRLALAWGPSISRTAHVAGVFCRSVWGRAIIWTC